MSDNVLIIRNNQWQGGVIERTDFDTLKRPITYGTGVMIWS